MPLGFPVVEGRTPAVSCVNAVVCLTERYWRCGLGGKCAETKCYMIKKHACCCINKSYCTCKRKLSGFPLLLQIKCSGAGRCTGSNQACTRIYPCSIAAKFSTNSAKGGTCCAHWSATNFAPKLMSQQACRVCRYLHKPQIPLRQQTIVKLATLIQARTSSALILASRSTD